MLLEDNKHRGRFKKGDTVIYKPKFQKKIIWFVRKDGVYNYWIPSFKFNSTKGINYIVQKRVHAKNLIHSKIVLTEKSIKFDEY